MYSKFTGYGMEAENVDFSKSEKNHEEATKVQ